MKRVVAKVSASKRFGDYSNKHPQQAADTIRNVITRRLCEPEFRAGSVRMSTKPLKAAG